MTTLTTKDTQYRKEIVKMARQAGFIIDDDNPVTFSLEAFAKLVASAATAKEREACAKVCEEHGKVWAERFLLGFQATLDDAADAIRARGITQV
jgi:hypothetical protein